MSADSPDSDFAAGTYRIQNLTTSQFVLRGDIGQVLRTGPLGSNTAVFQVRQVGDNAQIFLELATQLRPVPSASVLSPPFLPDIRAVIWQRFDAPWVFRATGPGQLNFGRIPEQPNTFWAEVQHGVLLQPIGSFSNWRLIPADPQADAETN